MSRAVRALSVVFVALLLTACTAADRPSPTPIKTPTRTPSLTESGLKTSDGMYLPVTRWNAANGPPEAVILAIHGFGHYAAQFNLSAPVWAEKGLTVIAYDQRGFGRAPDAGRWAGTEAMVGDARSMISLAAAAYPDTPIFVLGTSMGGAVAVLALNDPQIAAQIDGAILVAPATWSKTLLNPLERFSLWFGRTFLPELKLTGAGLNRVPTDNIEALRRRAADPLVIKEVPIRTTGGLVDLMTAAYSALPHHDVPTLAMFGEKEDILSDEAVNGFIGRAPDSITLKTYAEGYHMLLQDLQRQVVIDDITQWIARAGDSADNALTQR